MVRIRVCKETEIPLLKEMTAEAFEGVAIDHGIEQLFGTINGHDWRWRKMRHVEEDFHRDRHGIYVAESDSGELIGYVSSWCDREAGLGHIPNVVVKAGHRHQGIGRLLLMRILDHFREQGLTHAKIETLVQNETGRSLYQSVGFREAARQIHFAMKL